MFLASKNGQQIEAQKMIQFILWKINTHIQCFESEADIYPEVMDSFLVITLLNFDGLNLTLPRSAPQVLPIFGGARLAGWGTHP